MHVKVLGNGLDSTGSRCGPVAGSCKQEKEHPDSKKNVGFLE